MDLAFPRYSIVTKRVGFWYKRLMGRMGKSRKDRVGLK